jgi:hypothetical protein
LLQLLLAGVAQACVYALVALGYPAFTVVMVTIGGARRPSGKGG